MAKLNVLFGVLLLLVGVGLIGSAFVSPIGNTSPQYNESDFVFNVEFDEQLPIDNDIPLDLNDNQVANGIGMVFTINFDNTIDYSEITDQELDIIKADGQIICVTEGGIIVTNCPTNLFVDVVQPEFLILTSSNSTITQLLQENTLGEIIQGLSISPEEEDPVKSDNVLRIYTYAGGYVSHACENPLQPFCQNLIAYPIPSPSMGNVVIFDENDNIIENFVGTNSFNESGFYKHIEMNIDRESTYRIETLDPKETTIINTPKSQKNYAFGCWNNAILDNGYVQEIISLERECNFGGTIE